MLPLFIGAAVAADDQPKERPGPRTDLYGDPLPEGAVARFGSVQFRHAGLSDYVFLPGGKALLTSGSDRVLRFWDVATGRQVRAVRLQGRAGPGRCITLSPDGKMLLAEDAGRLVFWDVESGKELQKILPALQAQLGFLYFSPDGKTLAVGRGDWRVSFWDLETDKEREISLPIRQRDNVQFHIDSSFHASFSPDGKWLVAGASLHEPLGVFEVATGREVYRFDCHAYTSTVSLDSKRLAVASFLNDKGKRETVLRVFDLTNGKEIAQFPQGQEQSYHSLAFSPDGKKLACGFSDQSFVLDVITGRVLYRLTGRPLALTFSPDGKILVASSGHRLRLWDAATGKELHDRPGEFGYNPALAVSPDGRLLAAGDWMEQAVGLWDTTGKLVRRLPLKGEGRYVRNLAFSADSRSLVSSQGMGFLQFWEVANGKEQRTVQLRDPAVPNKNSAYFYELHASPDLKQVSALDRIFGPGGQSTRLALWETSTARPVGQQQFPGELRQCAWSANGKTAALLLNDGLSLVELPTGLVMFHIRDAAASGPIAASADGRLIAGRKSAGAGGGAETVAVWEAVTGKEVATVTTGPVRHLALAPDNRSLVTTDEGYLHVWDLATAKELRRWNLPQAGTDSWGNTCVFGLVVSPGGRRAFTALADGTALVWDLSPALRAAEPLTKQATEKDLAAWWSDLSADDAARAYAAIWRMTELPEGAVVSFLRKHLKPALDADSDKVEQLIKELDNDKFEVREKASKQLEDLGKAALPALRAALRKNPSVEVRRRLETLLSRPENRITSPEILGRLRAIQVLERIASKEAPRLLAELATGADHAPETQDAKATLQRLAHRSQEP